MTVPRLDDRPSSERAQYSTHLVVGVPGQHSGSAYVPKYVVLSFCAAKHHSPTNPKQNSAFGKAFAAAATRTNAKMSYASFDTFIVEVAKEDLLKFTEYLQAGLYMDAVDDK